MAFLSELIARLEAAEGSRELDGDIEMCIKGDTVRRDGPAKFYCWYITDMGPLEEKYDAPHYTTSLDAALTLVPTTPQEWDWIIERTNGGLTIMAQVGPNRPCFADTPAIALCIAALKAMEDK